MVKDMGSMRPSATTRMACAMEGNVNRHRDGASLIVYVGTGVCRACDYTSSRGQQVSGVRSVERHRDVVSLSAKRDLRCEKCALCGKTGAKKWKHNRAKKETTEHTSQSSAERSTEMQLKVFLDLDPSQALLL